MSKSRQQEFVALDATGPKKRYCRNKLSKTQFVILVSVASTVIFFSLALAIGYLVCVRSLIVLKIILPALVPKIVYGFFFDSDWRRLQPERLELVEITDDATYLHLTMYAENWKLPISFATGWLLVPSNIKAEMQPMTFEFKTKHNGKSLFNLEVSDKVFMDGLHGTRLDIMRNGLVVSDPENLAMFFNGMADWYLKGANQTVPFELVIDGRGDVLCMGIPIRNVDFHREQSLEFIRDYFEKADTKTEMNQFRAMIQELLTSSATSLPSDEINLGLASVKNLDLNVDSAGFSLKAEGTLLGKQIFQASLGNMGLTLNLNEVPLAKISVEGINLTFDDDNFKIAVNGAPAIEAENLETITKAADMLTQGKYDGILAGIGGMYVQGPNGEIFKWLETFLSKINVNVPVNLFQKQLMTLTAPKADSASLLGAVAFENLIVDMLPNNYIQFQPNVTIPSLIQANVNVAPFTFEVSDDVGQQLITVGISQISMSGGNQTLSPTIKVELNSTEISADAMGAVVSRASLAQTSFISIGNVKFEGPEGEMAAMNRLFTVLRVRVPVDKLIYGKSGQVAFIAPANNAAGARAANTPPMLDLSLLGGALSVTDHSIIASLDLSASSLLPIEALLPYISLRIGLDDIDAVKLEVRGLALQKGSHVLNNTIELSFSNDAALPGKMSDIIGAVMNDSVVSNTFVIQGLRLGPSEKYSYGLFDRLNIRVPGYILGVLPTIINPPKNESAPAATKSVKFNMPEGHNNFDINSMIPVIQKADLSTQASATIQLHLDAKFMNNLPFSLEIPYIGLDMMTGGNDLVSLSLQGIKAVKGENNQKIKISASFSNGASVKSSAENIARRLIDGESLNGVDFSVRGLVIGLDDEKSIQALRALTLPVVIPSGDSPLDISKLAPWAKDLSLDSFHPVVKSVDVATVSDGININAGASLDNPAPVSVRFGYIAADITLEGSRFIGAAISNINIATGKQDTSLGLHLSLGREDELREKVAILIDKATAGQAVQFSISGLEVGQSQEDKISVFNAIELPVQLPISTGDASLDMTKLAPWTKDISTESFKPILESVDISTIFEGLALLAGASITNPAPVSLSVGYIAADITIEGSRFVGAAISDINFVPGQQVTSLGVQLSFGREAELKTKVATLFKKIMASQPFDLAISGIEFGSSYAEKFSMFSTLNFPLHVPALDAPGSNDLKSKLLENISQKITNLDLATTDVGIGANIGLSFSGVKFKAAADFGFLAVDLQLQGSRLATLNVVNVKMNGQGEQTLQIPASLNLAPEDSSLADNVAAIINPLLNGSDVPLVKIGARKLVFGASQNQAFDFLSEIELDMIIDPKTVLSSASTPTSLPEMLLSKVDVSTSERGFDVLVKASVGAVGLNKVTLNLGYLDLGISVENADIVMPLATLFARDVRATGGVANDLELPVGVNLMDHDPRLPTLIATLVDLVMKKQPIPAGTLISGSGIYFGSDESHKFSMLSKIAVKLDITKIIPGTGLALDGSGGPDLPFEIVNVIGKMRDDLVLGLDIGLKLKEKLPIPLSLNLDYFGLEAWIGNSLVPLPPRDGSNYPDSTQSKVITAQTSARVSPDASVSIHIDIAFINTLASKRQFNYLLNCILALNCHESNLSLRNIRFGKSVAISNDLLAKIYGDLEFHQEGTALPPIPDFTKLFKVSADLKNDETGISGTFSMTLLLPFEVDIDIGYFQALGVSALYSTVEDLDGLAEVFGLRAYDVRFGTKAHVQRIQISMPNDGENVLSIVSDLLNPNLPYLGVQIGRSQENKLVVLEYLFAPFILLQFVYRHIQFDPATPPLFQVSPYTISREPFGLKIPVLNNGDINFVLNGPEVSVLYGPTKLNSTVEGSMTIGSVIDPNNLQITSGNNEVFVGFEQISDRLAQLFLTLGEVVFPQIYFKSPVLAGSPWFTNGLLQYVYTMNNFIKRFKYTAPVTIGNNFTVNENSTARRVGP